MANVPPAAALVVVPDPLRGGSLDDQPSFADTPKSFHDGVLAQSPQDGSKIRACSPIPSLRIEVDLRSEKRAAGALSCKHCCTVSLVTVPEFIVFLPAFVICKPCPTPKPCLIP